jgi:hypothetical protein
VQSAAGPGYFETQGAPICWVFGADNIAFPFQRINHSAGRAFVEIEM